MINVRNIQILAIQAVEEPDWEASYRDICREYARKFNTPLHIVEEELPVEYVLTHYYESLFGDLRQEAKTNERAAETYYNVRFSILYPGKAEKIADEDENWAKEMMEKLKTEKADNPNIIKKMRDEEISISIPGENETLPKK